MISNILLIIYIFSLILAVVKKLSLLPIVSLILIVNIKIYNKKNKIINYIFWLSMIFSVYYFYYLYFKSYGFKMYTYMLFIGLILNALIVMKLGSKYKLKPYMIASSLIYENIGLIIGAKALSMYHFNKEILTINNFFNAGYLAFGGLFVALVLIYIYSKQVRKDIKYFWFTYIPPVFLLYLCGKIGCFFNGCCYGIPYSGVGSVISSRTNELVFPVQLVEAISFIPIFIYLISKAIKNKQNYKTLGIGVIWAGIFKFLLDFFRNSHIGIIISMNQYLCFLLIFIGIIFIIRYKKDKV